MVVLGRGPQAWELNFLEQWASTTHCRCEVVYIRCDTIIREVKIQGFQQWTRAAHFQENGLRNHIRVFAGRARQFPQLAIGAHHKIPQSTYALVGPDPLEMKVPTADSKDATDGLDFLSTRASKAETIYGFVLPRGPTDRVLAGA